MSLVAAFRCATTAGWPWPQSFLKARAVSSPSVWPVTVSTTCFTVSWISGELAPTVTVAAPSTTTAATDAPFVAASSVMSFASIRPSSSDRPPNECRRGPLAGREYYPCRPMQSPSGSLRTGLARDGGDGKVELAH